MIRIIVDLWLGIVALSWAVSSMRRLESVNISSETLGVPHASIIPKAIDVRTAMSGYRGQSWQKDWVMFIILSEYLMLFAFASTPPSRANCQSGVIRQSEFGKQSEKHEVYCSDRSGSFLSSPTCQSSKCIEKLNHLVVTMDFDKFFNETGNPRFHLCRNLEGRPQVVWFRRIDGKFQKFNRCLFPDGRFVDTGTLWSWLSP